MSASDFSRYWRTADAAALAVASALSATVWQRRVRLAALTMQGYDTWQLWRAVVLESAVTIGVGALVGALVGICSHALASRFLERTTGFPAPFYLGPAQVLLTLALIGAIALAVIAPSGEPLHDRATARPDLGDSRSRPDAQALEQSDRTVTAPSATGSRS